LSRRRAVLDTNHVLWALLFGQGRLARRRAARRGGLVLPLLAQALAGKADAVVDGARASRATAPAFPVLILTPTERRARRGRAEARP
jgi:hypothetical protein